MAKSLRRPPVQGTPDPGLPGHVLVPVRKPVPGMPKVNYSVPDTSFFRVSKRGNQATAIVTVTPTGLHVAWDTCGQCARTIRTCDCNTGVSCPNSITHIWVTSGGIKPEPPVHAVVFQPPTPRRALNPVKPKRTLKRSKKQQVADEQAAEALIGRTYRKLNRRK